jgi:hypothetical protein
MRLVYMGRNDGFVSRQMLGCELLGDLMCQLRRDLVRLERLDDVIALPSGDLAKGALCVHHLLRGMTGIAADIIGQQVFSCFNRICDVTNRLPQAAVPIQNLRNCHYCFATSYSRP